MKSCFTKIIPLLLLIAVLALPLATATPTPTPTLYAVDYTIGLPSAQAKTLLCTDSDATTFNGGRNIYKRGTASGIPANNPTGSRATFNDECTTINGKTYLKEYRCYLNKVYYEQVSCPTGYSCNAGECQITSTIGSRDYTPSNQTACAMVTAGQPILSRTISENMCFQFNADKEYQITIHDIVTSLPQGVQYRVKVKQGTTWVNHDLFTINYGSPQTKPLGTTSITYTTHAILTLRDTLPQATISIQPTASAIVPLESGEETVIIDETINPAGCRTAIHSNEVSTLVKGQCRTLDNVYLIKAVNVNGSTGTRATELKIYSLAGDELGEGTADRSSSSRWLLNLLLPNHYFQANLNAVTGTTAYITFILAPRAPTPSGSARGEEVACVDSDGGKNYLETGTTKGIYYATGKVRTVTDWCGNVNQVVELYCGTDNKMHAITHSCSAGQTCQDGACKAIAQEREELECHDTDDNNNGFKGVAHGILIGTTDEEVTKSDACTSILAGPIIPASQSSRYLQEWRCNTANRVYAHYIECPNGQSCNNGACSTPSSIVPPQGDEETVCIDSDNGKNLRVQGTTSGINKPAPGRDFSGTYTDSCRTLSTGPRVLEYSCNEENQVIFTYHECPAGTECNNGACKAVAAAQEEFLCGDETPAERNPAMHVGDYLKGGALNGYAVRLISISPFSSTDLTQVRDAQFQVQDKNGNALAYLKIEEGKTEKVSSLALLVKVTKLYKDADGIASADVSAEMCATAPVNPSIPMPSDEETVPPLVQKFALSQGWNLVAPQATRSLVISSNCHEWTMWTYDAFKQRYENAGRLTDNNYLPEKAFWVKAPTACVFETASRTGTLTLSYGMTLATGWNLIPGTSELWNVVQGNCLLVTGPYNYANGDWTRQVMLSRGKGYFVNVQSECTLGKNANQ